LPPNTVYRVRTNYNDNNKINNVDLSYHYSTNDRENKTQVVEII